MLGHDEDLYAPDEGAEPAVGAAAWRGERHGDDQLHLRHHRTTQGRADHARNIWTNAMTFALHAGVTDRDVYLHTLPMFHANSGGCRSP